MSSNKFAVIFACDHNYIWPALVAANALVNSATMSNFDVRICSTTFVPDGFDKHCGPNVTAEIVSMRDFVPKTGVGDRHSVSTFACLFAIEHLSHLYKRVLYLDADICVNGENIDTLWKADLGSKPIGAVSDGLVWGKPNQPTRQYMKSIGCVPKNGGYFNGGCIMVDCKSWLSGNYYQKIYQFLEDHSDLCRYHDQSAFNAIFAQNWAEISFLWNWQCSFHHNILLIQTRAPTLVHFNHRFKPWNDPLRMLPFHYKIPFVELAEKGLWSGAVLENMVGRVDRKIEAKNNRRFLNLYQTLPAHLESISAYLSRTDFIDFPRAKSG